jgi:hypothetical protein
VKNNFLKSGENFEGVLILLIFGLGKCLVFLNFKPMRLNSNLGSSDCSPPNLQISNLIRVNKTNSHKVVWKQDLKNSLLIGDLFKLKNRKLSEILSTLDHLQLPFRFLHPVLQVVKAMSRDYQLINLKFHS